MRHQTASLTALASTDDRGAMTITAARDTLRRRDHELQLAPRAFRCGMDGDLDLVCQAAHELGITDTLTLTKQVEDVLLRLTGQKISAPTVLQGSDEAIRLHRYRNVLCALLALNVHDPSDVNGVLEGTEVRVARTRRKKRCLTDDEILLMRVYALRQTHSTNALTARAGVIYALCEAGLDPHEIAYVRLADLEDGARPTRVRAVGYAEAVEKRLVPLEAFAAAVADQGRCRVLLGTDDTQQPLAYGGRKHEPGSNSSYKSVHVSLNHSLVRTGLKHTDTTPGAVSSWRHQLEYTSGSNAAVQAVCGRRDVELLKKRFLTFAERRSETTTAQVEGATDLASKLGI